MNVPSALRRLVILGIVVLLAAVAITWGPGAFRDPHLLDVGGHSVSVCDPDYNPACPTADPNRDSPGGEPPGDNPVFSYPPGPSQGPN